MESLLWYRESVRGVETVKNTQQYELIKEMTDGRRLLKCNSLCVLHPKPTHTTSDDKIFTQTVADPRVDTESIS